MNAIPLPSKNIMGMSLMPLWCFYGDVIRFLKEILLSKRGAMAMPPFPLEIS